MLGWWLRLGLDAMGGDLMNLARSCHVHHVIGLHLNLVARGQEGIEAHNQVGVAFEQLGHTTNHSWGVNALRFKFLHDVKKIIVDLRLTTKLQLHLVKIGQRVLHLKPLKLLLSLYWRNWWGRMSMTLYHLASMGLHSGWVMMTAMNRRDGGPVTARALRYC